MRVRDPRARQRDVGARVGRADRSIVTGLVIGAHAA